MEQLVNEEKTYQSNVYADEKSHIWSNATELVKRYGKDSLAYLTLEKDKEYFFGSNTEGFIAYKVIDNIAVCMGNPIYQEGTLGVLYKEFIHFCKKKSYKVCFCSISNEFSMFLKEHGFSVSKYGEEALIDLNVYELKGSSTSKLRQKLRRAEKFGITVMEYIPKEYRDYNLEEKILHISEQWLANKNGKMGFSLGDLNLDKPLGRRYFVAIDEMKNLHAVLMFSPFEHGEGYFLDVMRRSFEAVPGVMEKSIIDAAMKMKAEGIKVISLGLAPLAGIEIEGVKCTTLEKGMHFMYKNFSQGYDFKNLHDYKKKFAPTLWKSRYIAHESSLSPIRVVYAMIKARKGDGVWWTLLKGLWESRKVFAFKSK